MRIEGTALYIQVKENQVVKQEKAEAVPVSGNIIADCDDKIAKIITRAGIPQVVPDTDVKKVICLFREPYLLKAMTVRLQDISMQLRMRIF